MERKFYVLDPIGPRRGPFTVDELREEVAQGRAKPEDRAEDSAGGLQMSVADALSPYAFQPASPASRPAPWVFLAAGAIVVLVAGGAIMAAILVPVFAQARLAAKRSTALSDLKQVGLAVQLYAADADDVYPPDMSSMSAAYPYLDEYLGRGAEPKTQNPEGGEVLGNRRLSAQPVASVASPATTLMFFDSLAWPDKKRCGVLTDGSARTISEEDFAKAQSADLVLPPTPTALPGGSGK